MKAEQLKESILQSALQGKLVTPSPFENEAESLLTSIIKEKELLVKTGKLKKQPEFEPINPEDVPFSIPKSWTWTRLGNIFNLQAGKNISSSKISETNFVGCYPCFGGNGCRGYVSTFNREGEYPIIGRQGALCGNVNRATGKFYATEHAVVVDTFCGVDVSWACYFLHALNLNQYATATAQPGLAVSNINCVLIPLPPLEEQKRIVAKLDEILPLVEKYGKSQEALDKLNASLPQQLKASILQEAIQGKLVPQDPTEEPAIHLVSDIRKEQERLVKQRIIKVGKFDNKLSLLDLPEGWTSVKLGEISSLITKQTGFDYSNHIKPNLTNMPRNDTLPMIQTRNFKGRNFDFDTEYYIPKEVAMRFPNILLDRKCMLLSIVGASVGNVGIFDDSRLCMIGGAICKVVLLNNDLYDYIFYFLQSPAGKEQIYKNFKSTAQGTIMVQDVREIEIPIPPLAEQRRIVAKLDELLPKIDLIKC